MKIIEQNSLVQILKTFTKKEINEFGLFIHSPFFNKNKNVIELFKLIRTYYPGFGEKIDWNKIYLQIFLKKYNEGNMKTIIFLLTRLAEKFMAYKEYNSNPYEEKKKLLAAFDKRKLDKMFFKNEKKILEELNAVNGNELNLMNEKLSVEKLRSLFYTIRNDEINMYKADLKTGKLMIASFFIEMFRMIILFERIKHLGFELEFDYSTELMKNIDMENFFNSLRSNSFQSLALLEMYYFLYKALNENETDKYYLLFKKGFNDNKDSIAKNEQYILSTLMVNYLYYRHLKDMVKYDRELFEAFKILLSLYDYSGEKYLRSVVYTNVLRMAVGFREFEWTENYIKEFSAKLKPEQKENMFYYSNAYLAFAKKEFEKTLEYSSKINFETFQMKYYLRDLQLSALYELKDYESALSLIDAYRHFIKNDKNYSPRLKKGYIDFIRFVNILIKLRLGEGKLEIQQVKQKISDSNPMRKA